MLVDDYNFMKKLSKKSINLINVYNMIKHVGTDRH